MSVNEKGEKGLNDGPLEKFSHSKLSAFAECARFWKIHYLDRVDSLPSGPWAAKGQELHKMYQILDSPAFPAQVKRAMTEFCAKKYPQEYYKYLKRWVPYRTTNFPAGDRWYPEQEMYVSVRLPESGKTVKIHGFIDHVNRNDPDRVIIVDFKSGKDVDDPKFADQHAIYALAALKEWPEINRIETLIWDCSDNMARDVVKNHQYVFTRKDDLQALELTIGKLIEEVIRAAQLGKFPATPCRKCRECPDLQCEHKGKVRK